MVMAWDLYGAPPEPPPPKRILFVVNDVVMAAKLRDDLASAHMSTIAPGFGCYEKDFDIVVMCFEPTSDRDQRWFHEHVKPLLSVNGTIYWNR